MAKKKNRSQPAAGSRADQPATLKDLLNPEVLDRLKAQAEMLKTEESKRLEEERMRRESERKAEQKRLENDFQHLLNSSEMDWRKFK